MNSKRNRRIILGTSVIVATVGGLAVVIGSPFALDSLSRFSSRWSLLSDIGQTYGAISALLAAIGITGIAATIILQIRESNRSRLDAVRSRHYELYKAAIDDPDLAETSFSSMMWSSNAERKQSMFINLQLQFWLMLWKIGNLGEDEVRTHVADVLKTAIGRAYWNRFRSDNLALSATRKERKFFQFVEEEYARVAAASQSARLTEIAQNHKRKSPVLVGTVIAFAVGAVLGRSICRSQRAMAPDRGRRTSRDQR